MGCEGGSCLQGRVRRGTDYTIASLVESYTNNLIMCQGKIQDFGKVGGGRAG